MIEFRLFGSTISVPESHGDPKSKQRNTTTLDGIESHALRFCQRVRKASSYEEYLELLKYLYYFSIGKISTADMKMMVNVKFPKFSDEFLGVLEFYENLTQSSSSSSGSEYESDEEESMMRNKGNQLKQLDDELTPSYKFLPKNVSSAEQSSGCEPGDPGPEVLNFCCYSEGSFERYRKKAKDSNQEMLDKLEDELLEKNMVAQWIHSAKHNANKLYEAILKGEIKNPNPEVVNKHLTASNFRLIESLYGDQGLHVVDNLRHSPEVVLPLIIRRLKQKEKIILV